MTAIATFGVFLFVGVPALILVFTVGLGLVAFLVSLPFRLAGLVGKGLWRMAVSAEVTAARETLRRWASLLFS